MTKSYPSKSPPSSALGNRKSYLLYIFLFLASACFGLVCSSFFRSDKSYQTSSVLPKLKAGNFSNDTEFKQISIMHDVKKGETIDLILQKYGINNIKLEREGIVLKYGKKNRYLP